MFFEYGSDYSNAVERNVYGMFTNPGNVAGLTFNSLISFFRLKRWVLVDPNMHDFFFRVCFRSLYVVFGIHPVTVF